MKPLWRGLAVAAIHLTLLLGIAGRYAYDRATLPRVWLRVHAVDPATLLRGRYLILQADGPPTPRFEYFLPEHGPDPTKLSPGEELWAEVSRFPNGYRAIRLEVRRPR